MMSGDEQKSGITRREFVTAIGTAILGVACSKGAGGDQLDTIESLDTTEAYVKPDLSRTVFMVTGMSQPAKASLPARYHHPALETLLTTMAANGLAFYRSSSKGHLASPDGVIGKDDVVVIKINGQWKGKGGTNTDLLRGLITRIVEHPDGFTGEVVVADNRQDIFTGSFDADPNSDDPDGTLMHVVESFKDVQVFAWDLIRENKVSADGPWSDGYVKLDQLIAYPRFTTAKGTRVDLKRGILGPSGFEDRLRLINVPVLKCHVMAGATGTLKNYMGVLDVGGMGGELMKAIHEAMISDGLMAKMMIDVKRPDLNILDALWVIHQPPYGPQGAEGPEYEAKGYRFAGCLLGGLDPVGIDHAATTKVLYPSNVITPCGPLHPMKVSCTDEPPCLITGRCERTNPDYEDDRLINASFALSTLLGDAPVGALARFLRSSCRLLHGTEDVASYNLVTANVT